MQCNKLSMDTKKNSDLKSLKDKADASQQQDLSYADDIALVSKEVEQAQAMLINIEIEVKKNRNNINKL